jgi:ATPase subunit of ABC transporter with duplicated ATPase domains
MRTVMGGSSSRSNKPVLLLDEPNNDLDVDTLRGLEEGLESFPGCVVVISHDTIKSLGALTDVVCTGHYAAASASAT